MCLGVAGAEEQQQQQQQQQEAAAWALKSEKKTEKNVRDLKQIFLVDEPKGLDVRDFRDRDSKLCQSDGIFKKKATVVVAVAASFFVEGKKKQKR